MELEKLLLRKVGEAVGRFKMIRDGDRVAVALSGGKDSVTMLEALLLLKERAPIDFTVCAFTVEQGKFLRPIQPFGEYLKAHREKKGIRLEEIASITKIHPHDIWAVVDEARRLGVPGLERRAIGRTDPLGRVMLACLSSFFGWLKKNRRTERNPCADIARPDASPPRDRV